jgi:hypothetical protein
MFSLQVLGAVAQLERALIAGRTKAGLKAARSRGRVGGNPGLRNGDRMQFAKYGGHETRPIWTALSLSWTHGCRRCGGCARTSPGVISSGSSTKTMLAIGR